MLGDEGEATCFRCVDYIEKPVDSKRLLELVSTYLRAVSNSCTYFTRYLLLKALRSKQRRTDPPLGGELGEANALAGIQLLESLLNLFI